MRLVCSEINCIMEMKENRIPVYIIEQPKFFLNLLLKLQEEVEENKKGIFYLFEEEKELDISKNILLITDLFHLNFHNKKIISAIFSKLKEKTLEEEIYFDRLQLEEQLKLFLEKLIMDFPYPLSLEGTIEYETLFKMFHIQVDEQYESYLEKIIDYISLSYKLGLMKCIVFVNLKTILSKEECKKLYEECFYRKIPIILFENREYEYIIEEEEKIIIDTDLCEIFHES